ncbi:MAG: hypothetical protein R2705_00080 [Ilumatobacteraceae bacterium]
MISSLAVGLVMWLPPVWDEFRRTGNLSRLYHHFADSTEPTVGLRAATRALITEWNFGGAWLTGARHDPATTAPSLTGFLLFAALVAVGWSLALRRRDSPALTLQAVASAAALLGWFSATRIIGDFYDYVIRWSWVVAAFLAISASWSIWRTVADRATVTGGLPVARRRFAIVATAAVAIPSIFMVGQAGAVEVPYSIESKLVGGLADQLDVKLDPDSKYLLRWHDPAGLGGPGFGLILEMERRGYHFGADSWTRFAILQSRVYDESEVLAVEWLVTGEASIAAFSAQFGIKPIASFDPRTPEQQQRSLAARTHIIERLRQLGRDDLVVAMDRQYGNAVLIASSRDLPAEVNDAVSVYTDLRLPGAIFQVPPGSPLFTGP